LSLLSLTLAAANEIDPQKGERAGDHGQGAQPAKTERRRLLILLTLVVGVELIFHPQKRPVIPLAQEPVAELQNLPIVTSARHQGLPYDGRELRGPPRREHELQTINRRKQRKLSLILPRGIGQGSQLLFDLASLFGIGAFEILADQLG